MATATAPQQTRQTQLAKAAPTQLAEINVDDLAKLELIAAECGMASLTGETNRFGRALKLANGIRQLKAAMTPAVMAVIMDLQGTSLGFKTDKDKEGGYDIETVKECAIECILRGGQLIGNEMNIIASRFYATKEFFTRILREFPGLTDLELRPGVPAIGTNVELAYVPYVATWKLNGKESRLEKIATKSADGKTLVDDTRICVRVNRGMGMDGILGKAERKMRAAIFNLITGSNVWEGEAEEDPQKTIETTATTRSESLAAKLGVKSESETNGATHTREPGEDAVEETHDATHDAGGPTEPWLGIKLEECKAPTDVLVVKQECADHFKDQIPEWVDKMCDKRTTELRAARK